MGICCCYLRKTGRGRGQQERRSEGASQPSALGTFSLDGLIWDGRKGRISVLTRLRIKLAKIRSRDHFDRMKTGSRLSRLGGWSVRCASAVLALAFCASAFADPSNNVVQPTTQQPAQRTVKKVCYVVTASSAIPQPCDRLSAIPTTANPMIILGHRLETTK